MALSRAWFYETVPENDPYWQRVYTAPGTATMAYRVAAPSMARMACCRCAPAWARRRKYPLLPRAALAGALPQFPVIAAYAADNYTRLWYRVFTLAEMKAEYENFIAENPTAAISESTFIDAVFRRLRQMPLHPEQTADRTGTGPGTSPRPT